MKETRLTPIQVLGFGLTLRDARTGRDRRGKFGTFRLDDLRATLEVAFERITRQRTAVEELCAKHGAATLIAEADLTPDELELLMHAATDPRPTAAVVR